MEIPVPFLSEPRGAGDVAKAALSAVGIRQKKDCECAKRQLAMNQRLRFVPRVKARAEQRPVTNTSIWGCLPEAPEGWQLVERSDRAALYRKAGAGEYVLWRVEDGRHFDASPLRCDPETARAEYEALCLIR